MLLRFFPLDDNHRFGTQFTRKHESVIANEEKGQEFPALRLLSLAETVRPVEAPEKRPQFRRRLELADGPEFFER